MKTKTLRVDDTVFHELRQGADLRRMPIRVMMDFMGELALTALSSGVSEKWNGQETYSPQSGRHVVKMSEVVHERLSRLCDKIGMNVTTAIHEVFYSRRKELTKLKGMRMNELVSCQNAAFSARQAYNKELRSDG